MPIRTAIRTYKKTRKNNRKPNKYNVSNAKKGTSIKCIMKTCRSKKYQSIYGSEPKGIIRSLRQLFY